MDIKQQLANLTDTDRQILTEINQNIQDNTGAWGEHKGGDTLESGAVSMPWVAQHQLIQEFVQFMYDKDLVIPFDWKNWTDGRDWMSNEDEAKYDNLDAEFIVKFITAAIRQDRFDEGLLVRLFELGVMQKIVSKLTELVHDN